MGFVKMSQLVALVGSELPQVQEQALWTLDNIVLDFGPFRRSVVTAGVLEQIAQVSTDFNALSFGKIIFNGQFVHDNHLSDDISLRVASFLLHLTCPKAGLAHHVKFSTEQISQLVTTIIHLISTGYPNTTIQNSCSALLNTLALFDCVEEFTRIADDIAKAGGWDGINNLRTCEDESVRQLAIQLDRDRIRRVVEMNEVNNDEHTDKKCKH
jgi:hypothetical protein